VNPWRKDAKQAFLAALSSLTHDRRVAIAKLVNELATDPSSVKGINYPNGDRESEVTGVWVRYRVDARVRVITFLSVTK
jgi:hypothetical protein